MEQHLPRAALLLCASPLQPSPGSHRSPPPSPRPFAFSCSDGNVDHWDKGLEMEAALGSTAAAGVAGAPDGVEVAAPARHHSATGLPPRGPQHHPLPQRVISSVLDAALAAVAGRGGRDGAGEAGGVSAPALLPDGRAHSGSNPPAMLDLSAAIERGGYATPAELSAEEEAAAADAAAMPPPPPQQPSGGLPPWPSPARVPPVPPLPLSRISGSSRGSAGSEPPDLLPPPPLAAPLGLQPPVPQPALWSRGRPGGGLVGPGAGARRPPGLTLDTEGLTFETFGLESPDTITPGLQYARQVAQLFVEGRRRSGTSMAGGGTVGGASAHSSSTASLASTQGGASSLGGPAAAPSTAVPIPSRLGQRSSAAAEQAPPPPPQQQRPLS